jgi:predicted RNA-binding Zn ribbon-like protein
VTGSASPPPGLGLIADFVNTIDLEDEADQIADAGALRDWLGGRNLLAPGSSVSGADVQRAHELREAIRALILANNGEPLDPDAIETLNAAADHAHLRVRFAADGRTELVPDESGVPGALARILGLTHTAMADDSWPRLKACRQHTCQWAFYDQSKNRSRTWCSMKVCGNRTKARAYRERRRG